MNLTVDFCMFVDLPHSMLAQELCTNLLITHPVSMDNLTVEIMVNYTFCPSNISLYEWVILNCRLKRVVIVPTPISPPALIHVFVGYTYVCPYFPPSTLELSTLCVKPWGPIDEDDRLEVLIETGSIVGVEKENYEATLKYWANISSLKLHAITTIVHEPQSSETDLEPAIVLLPNGSRRPEMTLGEQYDIVLFSGHGGDLLIVYNESSSEQSINPLLARIIPNATLETPSYWGTSSVRLYYVDILGREESTYWGYGDTEWIILNACNSLNLSDALKITGMQSIEQLLEAISYRAFMGTIEYKAGKRLFDLPHPANMYLHGILGWTTKCDWPLWGNITTTFLEQLAANNTPIGKTWLQSLRKVLDGLDTVSKIRIIGKKYGLGIISPEISLLTESGLVTYDYGNERLPLLFRDPAWMYYDACSKGEGIRINMYFNSTICSIEVPFLEIRCNSSLTYSIVYYKSSG